MATPPVLAFPKARERWRPPRTGPRRCLGETREMGETREDSSHWSPKSEMRKPRWEKPKSKWENDVGVVAQNLRARVMQGLGFGSIYLLAPFSVHSFEPRPNVWAKTRGGKILLWAALRSRAKSDQLLVG